MLEVKKLANLNVCIIKLTGPSECIFEHSIVTIQFVSDIGSWTGLGNVHYMFYLTKVR